MGVDVSNSSTKRRRSSSSTSTSSTSSISVAQANSTKNATDTLSISNSNNISSRSSISSSSSSGGSSISISSSSSSSGSDNSSSRNWADFVLEELMKLDNETLKMLVLLNDVDLSSLPCHYNVQPSFQAVHFAGVDKDFLFHRTDFGIRYDSTLTTEMISCSANCKEDLNFSWSNIYIYIYILYDLT